MTPHLDRRDDLFKWTVELHNVVNESLGKPRITELEALGGVRMVCERCDIGERSAVEGLLEDLRRRRAGLLGGSTLSSTSGSGSGGGGGGGG